MCRSLGIGLVLFAVLSDIAAQAAVNGVGSAIVTPAYDGSGGNPNTSYIRFFNGNFATGALPTTFTVSIVGGQSGQLYGQPFTIRIPPHASPQYSLGNLLTLAGATGPGAGAAKGDTSFMLFIKDPDLAAGYQHVTFNANTTLFENSSICNNGLWTTTNPAVQVLTNVHTSRLAGYPSVISFSNYFNTPINDTIVIYDAGQLSSGALTPTAGNVVGSTTIQVPANTTVTRNFTDLQATVNWNPGPTQLHADLLVFNTGISAQNVLPYVIVGQSILNNALGGGINMSTICAVNPTGGTSGFIASAASGTVFALTANQTIAAFTITNGAAVVAGAALPAGSLQATPTGSITQTSNGFNFTLPDGKTVNYILTAGNPDIVDTSDYQTLTTDSSRQVEVTLTNNNVSPLAFSTYGSWIEYDAAGTTPLVFGAIAPGIATSAATMPTTGTATYAGTITGIGFNSVFGELRGGTVSLSANFATKTITGSIANINVKEGTGDNAPIGTMNTINLTGTISGSGYTLTATPAAAPTGAYLNIAGATGTFSGTFSGPNAAELVGIISMSGGGNTVLATFGARQ